MIKLFLGLTLFFSSPIFADTLNDSTCEVAVEGLTDTALDKLVDRGYFPYHADYLPDAPGLYVYWSVTCVDKWYGTKCTTVASLKKVLTNGRNVLLHSDKTTGRTSKLRSLFKKFPKCRYTR